MNRHSTKPISFFLAIAVSIAISNPAKAQTQVVPPSFELAAGGNTFLGPLANSQRTYQLLLDSSQLTNLVGLDLIGISFRSAASVSTTWPASAISYPAYDIYLGEGVIPANRSLTFANNVVGPQKQVRSGPLNIAADSYPVGGPASFGPAIAFDSSYHYSGGPLLLEIRHQGFSGTSKSVDAIGTGHALYASGVSAVWNGNYIPAATGSQGNTAVIRFSFVSSIAITNVMVSTQNNVPAFIDTNAGTLQMEAEVLPSNANQVTKWSIVPFTGEATISSTGLITAVADGYVYAKAVSFADTTKADSLLVLIMNQALGIQQSILTPELKVYPNPVTDGKLMVELTNGEPFAQTIIGLSDMMGRLIQTYPMDFNTLSLDVSNLNPGSYILSYTDGDRRMTKKIVLQ